MNKELLYRSYIDLNDQIIALEAQRDGIRTRIVEAMTADGVTKDSTPLGTFSVAHKTTWIYSKAVEALDQKLKIKKIQEQKKGIATVARNPYLLFRVPDTE